MTGETEEELGRIHCYVRMLNVRSACLITEVCLKRPCSRLAVCAARCAALSFACLLPSCVWTAPCRRLGRPGDNGVAENMEQNQGKMGTSRALQRHWFSLCVCVRVLSCCFIRGVKSSIVFSFLYTEAETSESGLAKLMCRKALGVNLKRWVEAVMHMIKVKHAAYTENC